jgi:phytoene dehydrogenase-like protein
MTDALIGTFAANNDETLASNKCFLYHVIGNETGDWNIPVGGMGSVTASMREAAERFGADLQTGAEVVEITSERVVAYKQQGEVRRVRAKFVLANLAALRLHQLLGKEFAEHIEGAQVKVNMLLKRLPRLKSGVDPKAAFGGTFHINENYSQLQSAFEQASVGEIPSPLPCEIYCHSLTDPSILSKELAKDGVQTLTVFALHTPHSLLSGKDQKQMREALERAVIDSLNSVLAEPIEALLLQDGEGHPCIETKTTQDLEDALGLPGGNIFHTPLSWPFSERSIKDVPAERWGVSSSFENIFYCGSSAIRGGAVSGIAGHNAAMAVLEELGQSKK